MDKNPPAGDLVFQVDSFAALWEVFKHKQTELSALSKAFLEARRLSIVDVNGRKMIFEGLGWEHAEIAQALKAVGAAFNPQYLRKPPPTAARSRNTLFRCATPGRRTG
ncbi:MAG: hypothetical protein M5U26_23325 [Planctomycetota bacterium]|nr:hypothetical protein [Planctomycetota bacterium]